MADQIPAQREPQLDPECDVAEHAPEEVMLLRAAMGGLENALGCDAHAEEVDEAWKWAERVQTSAWALKNKLDVLRGPRACGRLLVGQGSDTYDPLCALQSGHEGLCKP